MLQQEENMWVIITFDSATDHVNRVIGPFETETEADKAARPLRAVWEIHSIKDPETNQDWDQQTLFDHIASWRA